MSEDKEKKEEKKAIVPKRDGAPIVRHPTSGLAHEGEILPNVHVEVTPESMVGIRSKSEKDLKKSDQFHLVTREEGNFNIVDKMYEIEEILPDGSMKVKQVPVKDIGGPLELRKKLAKEIVAEAREEIKKEAVKAVEQALARKDLGTLHDLQEEQEKGRKIRIESRRSDCMFLTIGRKSVML